ncbi:hypothetical protein L7F22_029787 [Adiantum nelumboides]|nr:hypothetical protein [Adiantum nelumboides]
MLSRPLWQRTSAGLFAAAHKAEQAFAISRSGRAWAGLFSLSFSMVGQVGEALLAEGELAQLVYLPLRAQGGRERVGRGATLPGASSTGCKQQAWRLGVAGS